MKIERIEKIANFMKDTEGKISANKLLERLNSISFWELLSETTKIEIPIIQRDFAQGRNDEKIIKIRRLFLDRLVKAIESESDTLELDFVYGDVKNGVFQPLDGQQRLTTLFLLHWYIALKSFDSEETSNLARNKSNFLKFTYETRISSREFCEELIVNGEKLGNGKTISEKIKDASWFFLTWKNDPTIKAMLIMLDSIESRLNRKSHEEFIKLWEKLISDNPPITFHFKQLNDIGLTDELYIKMNARGRALTDFENFKARFEKHIKENEFEKELRITDDNKEDWKELTEKTFSHKIDTVWTDLFWKHRGDDNMVDNEFVNFIAGVAINTYAQNLEILKSEEEEIKTKEQLKEKKEKNITEEAVKRERIERRITILFNNPNEITPDDFPTKISFEYLKSCFDVYSNKENKYDEVRPENLILWDFLETKKVKINNERELDNNFFIEFVKDSKTEYKQRVLFYAQTQFLLKAEPFNLKSFCEWIRVVRNIVQNATIDSASAYIGAIGLIKELSIGCIDIYNYLSKYSVKSGFAADQIKEEIIKSTLVLDKDENKEAVFQIEDANFCKGKIDFALYCCDFNIADKPSVSEFDYKVLNKVREVFYKYLHSDDVINDFRRAFFTIQNNDFYDYWTSSWLYAVNAPKRCLLANNIELKKYFALRGKNNENISNNNWNYLKDLVLQLTKKEIDAIIKDFIDTEKFQNLCNWKKRIIKEKGLLDFSEQHYIAIEEDECCWLIPQSKVANSPKGVKKLKKIK